MQTKAIILCVLSLVTVACVAAFPRTATAGQDGTAAHPYEIADADDLVALKDAVAAGVGAGLCYRQTSDIDMSGAGAFAGIGTYEANLNNGVPFTGTYDGGGHRISNVDFTQRNYGGIFNQVKGGTIRNLTVSNITCSAFTGGEWGCSIVGNAGLGATLQGFRATILNTAPVVWPLGPDGYAFDKSALKEMVDPKVNPKPVTMKDLV